MSANTALIILDAQVNMFVPPQSIHNAGALVETIQEALRMARYAGMLVVYVQHCGPPGAADEPGSPGWRIYPPLAPLSEDLLVQKTELDAFAQTNLHELLLARGVRRLLLAGMRSELCVAATCRRAGELGYQVTLLADAHGTRDDQRPAAATIAEINAAMGDHAAVRPTHEAFERAPALPG
ncbi:MAG TPA: cysteine hydrolase family protein [Herpetosiphonaceae bacterium]